MLQGENVTEVFSLDNSISDGEHGGQPVGNRYGSYTTRPLLAARA